MIGQDQPHSHAPNPAMIRIRGLGEVLHRWRWLAAAAFLVPPVLAVWWTLSLPPMFSLVFSVEVGQIVRTGLVTFAADPDDHPEDHPFKVFVDSPMVIERSSDIARRLRDEYPPTGGFLEAISKPFVHFSEVEYPGFTRTRVEVLAPSADQAREFARSVADDLQRRHDEIYRKFVDGQTRVLEAARRAVDSGAAAIEVMGQAADPRQLANAEYRQFHLQRELARMRQIVDLIVRPTRIHLDPDSPVEKVAPRPLVYGLIGLFIGVLLSIVAAVVADTVRLVLTSLRRRGPDRQ